LRLPLDAMRRLSWLTLPALFFACSSVPEVIFEDDRDGDAAPGSEAGTSSSGAAGSSGAPSSSGAAPPGESAVCIERKSRPDEKCCGDTPCWGNQCPNGCAWCAQSCFAADKKCCLHRGQQKCINVDEDCAEELDF